MACLRSDQVTRAAITRRWSAVRFHNALFGGRLRKENIDRPDADDPVREGNYYRDGWLSLRTLHPIRALGGLSVRNDAEVCVAHFGGLLLNSEGRLRGVFSAEPLPGVIYNCLAYPFIAPRDIGYPGFSILRKGWLGFIGSYPAPFWTEAVFYSSPERCGVID